MPSCDSTFRFRLLTYLSAVKRVLTDVVSKRSLASRTKPFLSLIRTSLPTLLTRGADQAIRSASIRSSWRGALPARSTIPSRTSTLMPFRLNPSARFIRALITRSALTSLTERAKLRSSPLVTPAVVIVVQLASESERIAAENMVKLFIIPLALPASGEPIVTKTVI